MFYSLANNPELWKDRINGFIALAPTVFIQNTQSKLFELIAKEENMKALTMKDDDPDTWSLWGPFKTA